VGRRWQGALVPGGNSAQRAQRAQAQPNSPMPPASSSSGRVLPGLTTNSPPTPRSSRAAPGARLSCSQLDTSPARFTEMQKRPRASVSAGWLLMVHVRLRVSPPLPSPRKSKLAYWPAVWEKPGGALNTKVLMPSASSRAPTHSTGVPASPAAPPRVPGLLGSCGL
jgi:hypothetical protein